MNMMQVYLDDAPCPVTTQSVAQAITQAAQQAQQAGRMIVEVLVDGQPWTDQQLNSEEMLAATANELRMTSVDPAELVRDTIEQARAALDEACDLQRAGAELLQADQRREAMGNLEQAIDIWLSVHAAATRCVQLLNLELADLGNEYVDPLGAVTRLTGQLGQLRRALLDDDCVTLSDTLLYELPASVDEWKSLLNVIAERACDQENIAS